MFSYYVVIFFYGGILGISVNLLRQKIRKKEINVKELWFLLLFAFVGMLVTGVSVSIAIR